MKNKKIVNLEWYNKIRKLIKEGEDLIGEEKLKIIPEEERNLYGLSRFERELIYNWDEIEELLNKDMDKELINKLPHGIKEFYEVDNEGNFTGKYDWNYIISIIESIIQPKNSKIDIFKMWDSEYAEEIQEILDLMPYGVAYLLENINDSGELYEIFAANTVNGEIECIDFPMQLRNNTSAMLSLFEECDCFDLENCWELLSDDLKQNKQFLETIFKLDTVQENSSVLLKINPELYKDDEDFKTKMLKCDCCYLFKKLWNEIGDSWDSVISQIDDEDFFKSCDNIDFEDAEIENSEFAEKLYDEIDRRITLAMQEDRKIEYLSNGEKAEKVPLNHMRARLISRDRKNLELDVQNYITGANGGNLKLPKEIAIYNTELENEEEDLTIIYGTDKQGRKNVLYYYPSPIWGGYTRQQRILNSKGDVTNMFRISAFDDGRVEDIDDITISYTYNEEGKKIYSLVEGWVTGTLYNEYDENGKIVKTTEIPTGITEQDCNIIAAMKSAVGKTIGNTDNAQAEINKLMNNEIELEGGEKDDN